MEWLQHILEDLTLFNQLWRKEMYPSAWNDLFLLPIFKSGSYKDTNNYRRISIMSCLGKLFCVFVNQRFFAWIEKNGKISTQQEGLWRRMGCDLQCFCLISGQVFKCFIDFKKAYDSVNHKLLWEKLIAAGTSSKILNLIKSMYKNIMQG